jgi:hypothetical protein
MIILAVIPLFIVLYFSLKYIKKERWMNGVLNECYKNKQDDECFVIMCTEYECPIHQRVNTLHIYECQKVGEARFINCYEHYIAFACKRNTNIVINGKYKYKGEYRKQRAKPGYDE